MERLQRNLEQEETNGVRAVLKLSKISLSWPEILGILAVINERFPLSFCLSEMDDVQRNLFFPPSFSRRGSFRFEPFGAAEGRPGRWLSCVSFISIIYRVLLWQLIAKIYFLSCLVRE
ncbi:hypothetical protein OUZ56_030159 [Daphnia magna]|uniref:Uncharacterized protein n=1 Tax=Daphnia magna TaxID=35525 RepID=A0ABQ9ZQG2_9CRUS|nr:hypothetical protein OUZ56_030159 [Daphnia magna]